MSSQECLNPKQHQKYLMDTCKDLQDFVCHDLLSLLCEMLSITNCPLRTPLQLEPHHVKNAELYQNYACMHLQKLQAKLVECQLLMDATKKQLKEVPPEVDLKDLCEIINHERNEGVKHRLQNAYVAMKTIQTTCNNVWGKYDIMHTNIDKSFQHHMGIVSTGIIQTQNLLIPELVNLLHTRKELEQELHDSYGKYLTEQKLQRNDFYAKAAEALTQPIGVLRDMLNITANLINEFFANGADTATELMAQLNEFKSSNETLVQVIKMQMRMEGSVIPILRSNLILVQKWLVGFQQFLVQQIIQPLIVKMDLSHAPASTGGTSGASTPLLALHSTVVDFYQRMLPNRKAHLDSLEKQHIQTVGKLTVLQNQCKDMKVKFEHKLKAPEVNKLFQELSNATVSATNSYQWQTNVQKTQGEQLELNRQLSIIQSEEEHTAAQVAQLAPFIERNRQLVQSLNRIIYLNNSFGGNFAGKWTELIEVEQQQCDQWNYLIETYHRLVLNFRSDTRQSLGAKITQTETALATQVTSVFETLIAQHLAMIKQLQELNLNCKKLRDERNDTISLAINGILNLTLTPTIHEKSKAAQLTGKLKDQIQDRIVDKFSHVWYDYTLCVQRSLILFTETLKMTLVQLFRQQATVGAATSGGKMTPLAQYMSMLDGMCCSDNSLGSALCPRGTKLLQSSPSSAITWIQLAKFPEQLHVSKLYTAAPHQRQAIQDFHSRDGLKAETESMYSEQSRLKQEIDQMLNNRHP